MQRAIRAVIAMLTLRCKLEDAARVCHNSTYDSHQQARMNQRWLLAPAVRGLQKTAENPASF
jgi:hypothetical protein